MIALEHGSLGPDYWLIEIESPNSRAYKSKPTGPVSALSVAMQQTRDWKAWINSHRLDAMRLFPSVFWKDNSSPTFRYKIIISKREWNLESSHRIQNLSQENGVEIRTFDYLTDELLQRPFYPTYLSGSSQTNSLPAEVRNTLASPFHRTLSGSDWEAILEGTEGFLSHMTSKLADRLLQRLEPGPRLAEFDDLWNAFATEDPTAASSISFVDNLMLR